MIYDGLGYFVVLTGQSFYTHYLLMNDEINFSSVANTVNAIMYRSTNSILQVRSIVFIPSSYSLNGCMFVELRWLGTFLFSNFYYLTNCFQCAIEWSRDVDYEPKNPYSSPRSASSIN